jgi:hypothetical protein
LACLEGGIVACFPLNISIVYSLKPTFVIDGKNLTGVGLTPGETIFFGSFGFTSDRFGNLSISLEGNDSGIVFVGMVHNGSLSLHTVLEESSDDGDVASGRGGAPDSPVLDGATLSPRLPQSPPLHHHKSALKMERPITVDLTKA